MQTIEELKEEYSSYIKMGYSDISVGFYKERKRDKIYDVFVGAKDPDGKMIAITEIGGYLFSFDKKIIYNFFSDYDKLSPEQKEIIINKFLSNLLKMLKGQNTLPLRWRKTAFQPSTLISTPTMRPLVFKDKARIERK